MNIFNYIKGRNYFVFVLLLHLFSFHLKNANAYIFVQDKMVFNSMPADFGTPIPYEGVEVSLKFLPNNKTLFLCPEFQTDGHFQGFHQDSKIPDDELLVGADVHQERNADDDNYSIVHMENKDDIELINSHDNTTPAAVAAPHSSWGHLHATSNPPLFPSTTSSKPIALLISRGQCSFEEKATQAALYNVPYLIVYNNVDQETLVEMNAFGDTPPMVNERVGLVFVSQTTGLLLQKMIKQHEREKHVDGDNDDDDGDFIVILNNQNDFEDNGWLPIVMRFFFWMGCVLMLCGGAVPRRAALESLGVTTSTTLSEEQVSKLPTVQHDEQQDHQQCSICLEDFTAGETLLQLPCQHKFHTVCIEPWLTTRHGSCPLCKREVTIQEESTSSTTTTQHRHPWFTSLWGRSGGRTLVATSDDDVEMTTVGTREEDSSLSTTSIIDLDASDNAIV